MADNQPREASSSSSAVPELTFDCEGINSKDAFWDKFLKFIGAMDGHGCNLDALADSMGGGCSDLLVRLFLRKLWLLHSQSMPAMLILRTHHTFSR